jgi:PadR family transcriptional regulator, regulatory protein PadR
LIFRPKMLRISPTFLKSTRISANIEQIMTRYYLGEFEEVVLLTVSILQDNAYTVTISHEITAQTGRHVRLNQVHSALIRLEDKGMLKSKMGNATEERGGRQKRLFQITALGRRALTDTQLTRQHLWKLAEGTLGPLSEI